MKVRVAYTVEATDELRRAINRFYGRPGLATRAQVRSWYEQYGESAETVLAELIAATDRHAP